MSEFRKSKFGFWKLVWFSDWRQVDRSSLTGRPVGRQVDRMRSIGGETGRPVTLQNVLKTRFDSLALTQTQPNPSINVLMLPKTVPTLILLYQTRERDRDQRERKGSWSRELKGDFFLSTFIEPGKLHFLINPYSYHVILTFLGQLRSDG